MRAHAQGMFKEYETEALFTKTEKDNEWNVNSQDNSSVSIQYICSGEFYIRRSTFEISLLI